MDTCDKFEQLSLGVEFGSTRIKAVLIDENCTPVATGSCDWENKLIDNFWTYSLDDVWKCLQTAYKALKDDYKSKYNTNLTKLSALGFSGMMHGYLPFDNQGRQLAEFRTWRNTTTYQAASKLTSLFNFNIPQRWSIAHLYQAILNDENHVSDIDFITTLAGYVHWKLSGRKVLGIGEASGMFPIDSTTSNYDNNMLKLFSQLDDVKKYNWNIKNILPEVLVAGENSGYLTQEGALLVDPTGELESGALMCPPEGDAGTGMTATNSVRVKTGNVSAGTSIFSMIVLDKQLSQVYEKIDMVTTPTGKPVAMVHCNNCCTDLDYWVKLFIEFNKISGGNLTKAQIYDLLYNEALKGDADAGNLVNFNYFSGEPVTELKSGRPLFARCENAIFNLPNFMRAQIYSTMGALKVGMEILEDENVEIDCLNGHGGLFKTDYVGQRLMAGAMNTPVAVMETAGEGGAWGIAILASYALDNKDKSLEDFLDDYIFDKYKSKTVEPITEDVEGFKKYMMLYRKALEIEKSATENI